MQKYLRAVGLAMLVTFSVSQIAAAAGMPTFTKTYNTHAVDGRVLESYPIYKAGTPVYREVCHDVEVPIYQAGDPANQAGNTVAGVVIGGIIGRTLTGDDTGGVAGAVLGGIAGANMDNRRIVGYRIEHQCNTVQDSASAVKYYESRIQIEGRIFRTHTQHPLIVGGTVRMYMPN